jgi:hypothetical protein
MVPRQEGWHGVRILLSKFCTAFDIREEKSDSSDGEHMDPRGNYGKRNSEWLKNFARRRALLGVPSRHPLTKSLIHR